LLEPDTDNGGDEMELYKMFDKRIPEGVSGDQGCRPDVARRPGPTDAEALSERNGHLDV